MPSEAIEAVQLLLQRPLRVLDINNVIGPKVGQILVYFLMMNGAGGPLALPALVLREDVLGVILGFLGCLYGILTSIVILRLFVSGFCSFIFAFG